MTRILLTVGAVAISAASAASPAHAVYDGERAPFGSYEFMVSLRPPEQPKHHVCGGTLIAPDIVLTAGHCLTQWNPAKMTAVVATDKPGWRKARQVRIAGYRVPGSFGGSNSNRDDVALLRLARPQTTPLVGLGDSEPARGAPVSMAGWGCTDRPHNPAKCRRDPTHLQAAGQMVVSDPRCDRSKFWNPPAHAATSICARGSDAVANLGDSGGPLLVGDAEGGFTQVGISSLLADKPRAPFNAYTSLPAVRDWIDRATATLQDG